jgi:hypothetical protein
MWAGCTRLGRAEWVPVIGDTLTSDTVVEYDMTPSGSPSDHRVRYNTRNIREVSGIRATVDVTFDAE